MTFLKLFYIKVYSLHTRCQRMDLLNSVSNKRIPGFQWKDGKHIRPFYFLFFIEKSTWCRLVVHFTCFINFSLIPPEEISLSTPRNKNTASNFIIPSLISIHTLTDICDILVPVISLLVENCITVISLIFYMYIEHFSLLLFPVLLFC